MPVHTGNFWLNQVQMEDNARYWWGLVKRNHPDWTLNATAAMLGNAQLESTINPGIWQDLIINYDMGYGLFQWTKARKYIDWCNSLGYYPGAMESAFKRIEYELANHLQYYATTAYPETFSEFLVSEKDVPYLTRAWVRNYERPSSFHDERRTKYALNWFKFLGDGTLPPDPPWRPVDGSFWWIYFMKRRNPNGFYQGGT